jgi:hypothetical protein
VLSVAVIVNERRYLLERAEVGKMLTASIQHSSGGVVMSNKRVSIEEWSRAMAAELAAIASSNAAAAAVLARLTTL